MAVDAWLQSGKLVKPHFETARHDIVQLTNSDDYANAHRPSMPELSVAERTGSFREVELGYDEKIACEEAKRCLRCDLNGWTGWASPSPRSPRCEVQGQQQEKGASE